MAPPLALPLVPDSAAMVDLSVSKSTPSWRPFLNFAQTPRETPSLFRNLSARLSNHAPTAPRQVREPFAYLSRKSWLFSYISLNASVVPPVACLLSGTTVNSTPSGFVYFITVKLPESSTVIPVAASFARCFFEILNLSAPKMRDFTQSLTRLLSVSICHWVNFPTL